MCGILFTNSSNVCKERFTAALEVMTHRGPDAAGCYDVWQGMQLGHNRLSILDLDPRSNQPFWSADRRYVMVYNGEVYNYQELARRYEINQQTSSDTEVVLELYARLGPDMLQELNGMFALVVVDTHSGEVFIARDRLGIKPLYFSESNGSLSISSEIAPLLRLQDKTDFDEVGIRQYRKLRTFFHGRTLYKGIRMLAPGCYWLGGKEVRYWALPEHEQAPPGDEELRELLTSAVAYRCISDVPVGSYLSGGLDSTIVAALSEKPDTWTVGFADHNEFPYARVAAERFGSSHHEVMINEPEFIELARTMIHHRREPLSVPNEVLLYHMTRQVKTKNTVILSGEGADELFFGYDRIFCWAAENPWDLKEFDRHYSYGSHEDLEIIEDVIAPYRKNRSCLQTVAAFFQTAHLHGLLRRLDNATMLCSVEARVPFVDHRLVERMAGVDFAHRMPEGVVKAPLKRVFQDIVPVEILERKKVGFPVPLEQMDWGMSVQGSPMDRWLAFNLKELGADNF